jgi:hypothetical protein
MQEKEEICYRTTPADTKKGQPLRRSTEVWDLEANLSLFRKVAVAGVPRRVVVEETKDKYQNEKEHNNIHDDFKS